MIHKPFHSDSSFSIQTVGIGEKVNTMHFRTYRVAKAAFQDIQKPYFGGRVALMEHAETGAYGTLEARTYVLGER